MKKYCRHIFVLLLALAAVLTTVSSCSHKGNGHSVMLIWGLEENDPVTKHWDETYDQVVKQLGFNLTTTRFYCNPYTLDKDSCIVALSNVLDEMRANRQYPDNIFVEGDYALNLVLASKDPRLHTIPVVSFGSHYPVPLRSNLAIIKDSLDLGKNLQLMRDLWPDDNRIVTELDWTRFSTDSLIREDVYSQLSVLDTTRYLNNIKLEYSPAEMDTILSRSNKIGVYALSLSEPHENINLAKRKRFATQFAFNQTSSSNRVLLFKHDLATRQITENPDNGLFCTATPESFEVFPGCAGGYFTPIDVSISRALNMGKAITFRTDQSWSDVYYLESDFYVNWDALRGSFKFEDIPSYVNVRNATFRDTNSIEWQWLSLSLSLIVMVATILMLAVSLVFTMRNNSIKEQMLRQANENVSIEEDLNFIKEEAGSLAWYVEDGKMYMENYPEPCDIEQGAPGYDIFFKKMVSKFLRTEKPGKYTIQVFGPSPIDPEPKWYELRMHVSETDKGIERHGVTVNINEQKINEARMLESHRMLAIAQEKESFISAMSHEMRTPLNSVVGFSQIATCKDISLTDEERQIMRDAVVKKGEEITDIINDMLTIAKMDNGIVTLNIEELPVSEVVDKTVSDFNTHIESIGLMLRVLPGPESATIKADKLILETALTKSLSNAAKFTPKDKPILIGWKLVDNDVVIYITDFGKGIPEFEQEMIFHRFYKSDKFAQGTGLGLAIAKEYMERLGGSISVESTEGLGATFNFRFRNETKGGEA